VNKITPGLECYDTLLYDFSFFLPPFASRLNSIQCHFQCVSESSLNQFLISVSVSIIPSTKLDFVDFSYCIDSIPDCFRALSLSPFPLYSSLSWDKPQVQKIPSPFVSKSPPLHFLVSFASASASSASLRSTSNMVLSTLSLFSKFSLTLIGSRFSRLLLGSRMPLQFLTYRHSPPYLPNHLFCEFCSGATAGLRRLSMLRAFPIMPARSPAFSACWIPSSIYVLVTCHSLAMVRARGYSLVDFQCRPDASCTELCDCLMHHNALETDRELLPVSDNRESVAECRLELSNLCNRDV
jgi:hypothetical protein